MAVWARLRVLLLPRFGRFRLVDPTFLGSADSIDRSEFQVGFRLMSTGLESKPSPSSAMEGEAEAAE
jgi:hypothetical protein